MASIVTNRGKYLLGSGAVAWASETLKTLLLTSTHAQDVDDNFVNDIVANEISVSGYTGGFGGAGRNTLASKTSTEDDTDDRLELDAADQTWTALGAGATVRYVAVIREVTNDGDSEVLAIIDLGADFPTNGGDLGINWSANGLLALA